jgi:hypothetical protein
MQSVLGWILTVAITFPLSFLLARACLKGVIRFAGLAQSAHSIPHKAAHS